MKIFKNCIVCAKQFKTYEFRMKRKHKPKYCSRICYYLSMKGRPSWNKGIPHTIEARAKISKSHIKGFIGCSIEGCIREHHGHKLCNYHLHKRKARMDFKLKVLYEYSKPNVICACCGERNLVFLTLDHIIPVRRKDKTEHQSAKTYSRLIRENFPKGYQVLCYNCNMAKRMDEMCPHQRYQRWT